VSGLPPLLCVPPCEEPRGEPAALERWELLLLLPWALVSPRELGICVSGWSGAAR
jgi:hypothetical protein